MKDNIIFRAKRKEIGGWVYGDLIHEIRSIRIRTVLMNDNGRVGRAVYNVIDPVTVCRFTGFRDSEGHEIYEGDVVGGQGVLYRIAWSERLLAFTIETEYTSDYIPNVDWLHNCIVMGNIYDDPELREATE